jgi:hypothetical protein
MFGNDDSAAPDLTTEELHQARRYIIQGEGKAPSRGREAKPALPVQRSAAD